MARSDRADLGPVSDEGDRVKSRRERLGMTIIDLAREAGVDRDTVSAIEHGKGYQAVKLTAITNVLDRIEEETGLGPIEEESPQVDPGVAVIELSEGERKVAVRWPAANAEQIAELVERLLGGRTEDQ